MRILPDLRSARRPHRGAGLSAQGNPRDAWPRWAQEERWTLDEDADAPDEAEPPEWPADDAPTGEDAGWAAEYLDDGDDGHDLDGPEPNYDALADLSAVMDRMEAGFLP